MGNTQKGLKNNKTRINKNGYQEEVNSEDEKNNDENDFKPSEYDKELSRVLFDEENNQNEEENNNNENQKRKKSLKEELRSYADEIAEEQFMEEINKSKSVNKFKDEKNKNKMNKYLNDNDVEEFNEFKKWKEAQNQKKQKNNINNNINIKPIKFDNEEKKRSTSTEKINMFKNKISEKFNKNLDEQNMMVSKNKEENMKQILKNYTLQSKNFKNDAPKNEINKEFYFNNNYNTVNFNENNKIDKNKSRTFMIPNQKKEQKSKNSEEKQIKKKKFLDIFKIKKNKDEEKETTVISKKIYQKMKKENIKMVSLYLKNGNIKYEQGLQLCGLRNYKDALTCFAHSKNSFLQLNKILTQNKKDYPDEFKNIINKKLGEKLLLVNQSIKECNDFLKRGKNNVLAKSKFPKDILKQPHIKNNDKMNMNINTNFSQIDDSFDFDFSEPDPNPKFSGKNLNLNQNNKNQNNNIPQNEDTEMDAKIANEIMQTNPGVKFSDIIGMQEMKKILYEIIIVPAIRPDFFTGIRKPQRGILLFGPPGTGKTLIAKAIASECNSTFFNISASSLTSKWVGESEKTVKSLFKLAYQKAPSIIFIDEIDSILSKRSENENEATKRLKTEFLIQFDGLGSNNNAKLLVIAATNRPMDLDEALLRRLPKRVYCGPLDVNGRFDFIKKVINRVETNLKDKDIMEIAKMTNGYSNSDLKELCKEAAFQPVRELTMEQILKIKKFRPLVKNDLVKAVKKIRGTMSDKIINELIKWNEQFGGV